MASERRRQLALRAMLFAQVAIASTNLARADYAVKVVAERLGQPVAIAVRPSAGGPDQVVIAEQDTGRLLAVYPALPNASPIELTPAVDAVQTSGQPLSPTSLAFLNSKTLLVGVADSSGELRAVHVLWMGDGREVGPIVSQKSIGELLPDDMPTSSGHYAALAVNDRFVYAAFQSQTGEGRLLRARHTSGMLSALRPLETAKLLPSGNFSAVALSGPGYVATVHTPAKSAQDEQASASQLVFADPEQVAGTSKPVAMRLDLAGVIAIAYSPVPRPTERRLYALVRNTADESASGIYRIDAAMDAAGQLKATGVKLIDIDRARAMAFGPSGLLYVIQAGDETTGSRLLAVSGEF